MRVLYIEDDENNRDMLAMRLGLEDIEVTLAVDGTSGLEIARTGQFDLILLDIGLPDIDGLQVARRLREDASTAAIPIIILTAHASPADQQQAHRAGCDDFDIKPVNFERLLPKMRAVTERGAGSE